MTRNWQHSPDELWRSILQSPFKQAYVFELYGLAHQVVRGAEKVFVEAAPPEADQSYVKVDHDIHETLTSVLSAAVRIKDLVTERRRTKGQSATDHGILVRRSRWLRSELLRGVKLSEILDAKIRNSLAHFDEYLDHTAVACARHEIGTPAVLPFDMVLGHRDSLAQFLIQGQLPVNYPLRVYVASERVFINCGREIDVGRLHVEAVAVLNRVRPLVPPPEADGSPGSHMLVLTGGSFP